MIIEPLKGKTIHMQVGNQMEIDYCLNTDIKSAVEWLKQNLREITLPKDVKFREEIIDKAFEDVTK